MKTTLPLTHLLESCKNLKSITQLHCHIIKNGHTHHNNPFFTTKLLSLYSKHSSPISARKLFDETPHRNIYLWNAALRCYTKAKQWEQALSLFQQMLTSTNVKPDNFTIPIALKACAGLSAYEIGRVMHGFVKKSDKIGCDKFVSSALVEFYAKCGEMGDALRVFEEVLEPDVVVWTSMVTGYQQNDDAEEALLFFIKMVVREGVAPDKVTLVSVASACAQLGVLRNGKSVHGYVLRMGSDGDLSLVNSLLNLYAKTGAVDYARCLFTFMCEKDVVSWSSMIACYAHSGEASAALNLFIEMVERRVEPNSVTAIAALQACAKASNVDEGRRIHELAKLKGFELQRSVCTALIDMYMKCSCIKEAIDLFQRLPRKDVVLWSTFISGYTQNGQANESLKLFNSMLFDQCRPDAVTMVKVLVACSELGNLPQAAAFHGYLVSSGFDNKVFIGAALIDLYSKCGNLNNSIKVFEEMNGRDVVVWSAMIAAYGTHGLGREAIRIFTEMIETSMIKPNSVTFVSVLSACSHVGLVDEGLQIFVRMIQEYHIEPNSEHYSIMVDLLGRAGKLDEALDLINRMPFPPGSHVWGALLGACKIHHNVEIGKLAAENLLRLDPEHAGYYLLLSNMYGEDGKWENMTRVRTLVKEKGLNRIPGLSSIAL